MVGGFHHAPSGNHLSPDGTRNGVKGGETSRDVFGTRETDSGVSDKVSDNGKHGNTAMLDFEPADLLISGRVDVSVLEQVEGVEKTKLKEIIQNASPVRNDQPLQSQRVLHRNGGPI